MNKLKRQRTIEKSADRTWAKYVKLRDKRCVICHDTNRLNAHHIIPREVKRTRWLLINGISLCPNHHKYSVQISAHRNPLSFFAVMEKIRTDQLNRVKVLLYE